MLLKYIVTNLSEYKTLKEVLKAEFNMSDRLLLKLKKLQKIYLNGKFTYITHSIKPNDIIECYLDDEEDNSNIVATQMQLNIIYEDEAFLIINKPAGIPVHPSMEHYTDSLSNGVKFYFNKINLKKKIRPVNRIDKDTSGIVIFAKNEYIQECLVKQMKSNNFVKKYIAVVEGHLDKKSGVINAPISRKRDSIIERQISENGDTAITHYTVLNSSSTFDVVECILETGRTHQIRVHFSHICHPLLGDTLYGNSSPFINRQALHAYKVEFIHPISKEKLEFTATIPNDIEKLLYK
ncbi:MAG: RluA family pseudouridine synthase [Clostridia bacterium]